MKQSRDSGAFEDEAPRPHFRLLTILKDGTALGDIRRFQSTGVQFLLRYDFPHFSLGQFLAWTTLLNHRLILSAHVARG